MASEMGYLERNTAMISLIPLQAWWRKYQEVENMTHRPMFEKRHYVKIAELLALSYRRVNRYGYATSQTLQDLESDFVATFQEDNSRFSEDVFRRFVRENSKPV